jgi:hypothetical protein
MNLFRVIPHLSPTYRRGNVKCPFRIYGGYDVACLSYWIHRSAPSECLYLVVRQVSFQLTKGVLCAAWVEHNRPRGTNGSALAFLFLHCSDLQNVRERVGQIPLLRTLGFVIVTSASHGARVGAMHVRCMYDNRPISWRTRANSLKAMARDTVKAST